MLLASLRDGYDHIVTNLLIGNDKVSLNEVCTALYNYKLRRNHKSKSRGGASEALAVRGWSQTPHKGGRKKSRNKQVRHAKEEYSFCLEKELWKKDCPELQKKMPRWPMSMLHKVLVMEILVSLVHRAILSRLGGSWIQYVPSIWL